MKEGQRRGQEAKRRKKSWAKRARPGDEKSFPFWRCNPKHRMIKSIRVARQILEPVRPALILCKVFKSAKLAVSSPRNSQPG